MLYLKRVSKLKDPPFTSWILIQVLLRTGRKENWTFLASPFSIIIISSGGRTKDLKYPKWKWNISTTLAIKFNLSTELFFASQKNISCTPFTPKMSFLNVLNIE